MWAWRVRDGARGVDGENYKNKSWTGKRQHTRRGGCRGGNAGHLLWPNGNGAMILGARRGAGGAVGSSLRGHKNEPGRNENNDECTLPSTLFDRSRSKMLVDSQRRIDGNL